MAEDDTNYVPMKDITNCKTNEGKKKCSNDGSENAILIDSQKHSQESLARLHTAALLISWISIVFSLGTGIIGIVLSVTGQSEALFAYGLDAILDSLSSVAVVWRFHVGINYIYAPERERKACIAIGILFIVSAISLIGKSVHAIILETHETKQIILYASFALSCGIISAFIAVTKIYVGTKIGSQALYTDSIITLVGTVTCFASVAGLEMYVENTDLWYLDSVFSILCGSFLFVFGINLLYSKLRKKKVQT
uniref:Uncharacterized protein n=1 Tax=Arion vulgaris TaxID=1028688 RepID=A0A0B7AIC3_9EUPU